MEYDSLKKSFDDAEFNKFCEQYSIIKIEKETLNSILTAFWSLHEKPAGDLTYCPYQANLPCLRQVVC